MQLIPVQDPQDRTVAGSGNGSAQAALSGLVIRVKFPCGTGLLAINLFRHESQPAFSDEEIDHVRCASPLILACVERHVALRRQSQPGSGMLERLPPRERPVCERLLKGWTHEGIAADLGIAAGTVKTYRDRAFEKLGIHHRNELFALALSEQELDSRAASA